MVSVPIGIPSIEKIERFSFWDRCGEVSGNMNERPFWAWQGNTWHVPEAASAMMPRSKSRFFSHAVLPVFADKMAHAPLEAMLKTTAMETIMLKSLFFMQDANSVLEKINAFYAGFT
jgi:hypothetical protein